MRKMGEIMSCQISFAPIMCDNYIEEIDKVLEIIKAYDIDYTIGTMSTTIIGNKNKIFPMIERIYNEMCDSTQFTLDIKLSNICGCDM